MTVSPVSGTIAARDQSHPFVGAGLRSFADFLASARPAGPLIDLGPGDDIESLQTSFAAVPAARLTSGAVASLPSRAEPWLGHIEQAAARHGVDPRLLTALVWTESAFREDAVSPAGAIGLGQLMPGTAAGMGVDPHDPLQNLDGAATYIATQLRNFGSVDLALAAYNAGPGRVQRAGGVPNIAETQAYVRIVTDRYESLSRGGQ